MRRRGTVLAALLVAASALVATGPARARTTNAADDSPYIVPIGGQIPGAQWQTDSYEQHFSNAESAGARWGFVDAAWSDIEVVPGRFDFSGLDAVVSSAHEHGLHLIVQVQATAGWSTMTPAMALATMGFRTNSLHPLPRPTTAAPMNIDAAIPYWKALVGRYRSDGELARARGWRDGWGVRDYEMENEPDFTPFVNGSWETVTKDYALYVAHVHAAVRHIDPSVRLIGPTLSGVDSKSTDPIPNTGLTWLRTLFDTSRSSLDFASDTYRGAGMPAVGAGPFLGAYSYHCDFADTTGDTLSTRAAQVHDIVAAFFHQRIDPTSPRTPVWCTEGGATAYDTSDDSKKYRYAWGQMQLAAELLGANVNKLTYDFGIQGGDSGSTWVADPIRPATRVLTTYFPSGHGVVPLRGLHTTNGTPVVAYRWTNPRTGRRSTILWAQDEPSGSGTHVGGLVVRVPVRGKRALVIDPHDWSSRIVKARGGVVKVTIERDDPSPPYVVVDQ